MYIGERPELCYDLRDLAHNKTVLPKRDLFLSASYTKIPINSER